MVLGNTINITLVRAFEQEPKPVREISQNHKDSRKSLSMKEQKVLFSFPSALWFSVP